MPRAFGTTNAAPYAVAPPVGAAGDTYFNTTSKTLYLSDGTQWIQVQGSSSAPTPMGYFCANISGYIATANGQYAGVIGTVHFASGFTAGTPQGVWVVTCNVAGLYYVNAQSTITPGGGSYIIYRPEQWRGGALLRSYEHVDNVPVAGYGAASGAGVFDVQVGDQIRVVLQSDAAHTSNDMRGHLIIIPASGLQGPQGATGPVGPDVTLQQSSSAYLAIDALALAASTWSDLTITPPAAPFYLNNFTIAANKRLTCVNPGRYRAQIDIGTTSPGTFLQAQIAHYNSAGQLIQSQTNAGTGVPTGNYSSSIHEAIVNMAAGDYLVFQTAAAAACTINASYSRALISPVGGTKGDKGDPGIAGNLASAYYAFTYNASGFIGKSSVGPSSTGVVVWPTTYDKLSGFVHSPDGGYFTCQQAGKYLINADVSISGATGAAYWMLSIGYNLKGVTNYFTHSQSENVGWYGQGSAQAVIDLAVGDYIWIEIGASSYQPAAGIGLDGRSTLSIVPVGGAKGDKGDKGDIGTQGGIGIIAGGLATITAAQTGITASASPGTALTGASCPVTTVTGRRYRISWMGNPYADQANVAIGVCILRDGVMLNNRAIQNFMAGNGNSLYLSYVDAPAAGAHTYSVSMFRSQGSGNVNNYADTTAPCQLTVEDVGSTTP